MVVGGNLRGLSECILMFNGERVGGDGGMMRERFDGEVGRGGCCFVFSDWW